MSGVWFPFSTFLYESNQRVIWESFHPVAIFKIICRCRVPKCQGTHRNRSIEADGLRIGAEPTEEATPSPSVFWLQTSHFRISIRWPPTIYSIIDRTTWEWQNHFAWLHYSGIWPAIGVMFVPRINSPTTEPWWKGRGFCPCIALPMARNSGSSRKPTVR